MPLVYKQYLVGVLGAAIIEVAYWYELRHQLESEQYQRCLRSASYWIVSILMIILAPIAAIVWFGEEEKVALKTYLVMGAAFPHFFKNAVAFFLQKKSHLGTDSKKNLPLSTYFLKR